MGVMTTIIVGILVVVLAEDLQASLRWLTNKLLRNAVSRLPEDLCDRYYEEWSADLDDTPGDVAKLLAALGFCQASRTIWRDKAMSRRDKAKPAKVRRWVDRCIAAFLLVAAAPLFGIIAVLIRLSSPGRIFVVEGTLIRFRTLDATGKTNTVGAWLRRNNLDELPSLINVLRGRIISDRF